MDSKLTSHVNSLLQGIGNLVCICFHYSYTCDHPSYMLLMIFIYLRWLLFFFSTNQRREVFLTLILSNSILYKEILLFTNSKHISLQKQQSTSYFINQYNNLNLSLKIMAYNKYNHYKQTYCSLKESLVSLA